MAAPITQPKPERLASAGTHTVQMEKIAAMPKAVIAVRFQPRS